MLMEAQSAPLFLWAEQEMNDDVTYRKFVSGFHDPFLEPLTFPTVPLYKGNPLDKEKVTSSNGIM